MIEYVPPPKARNWTPEQYARFGRFVIAGGFVFCGIGFGYFLNSGMRAGTAFIAILPLFGIFTLLGWSYCRMGKDGPGVAVGYLAAIVGLCGLAAAWLSGK